MPARFPPVDCRRRLPAVAIWLWLAAAAGPAGAQWITYDPCELQADGYYDGDSFRLRAPTRHVYVIRIYGADAPETDRRMPDRNAEQADHFGVNEELVLAWGEAATGFVTRFMRDGVRVETRKTRAGGASDRPRYWGWVTNPAGQCLTRELVRRGLARAHGLVELPDADDREVQRVRRQLRRLEAEARANRVGIWSGRAPDGSDLADPGQPPDPDKPAPLVPPSQRPRPGSTPAEPLPALPGVTPLPGEVIDL